MIRCHDEEDLRLTKNELEADGYKVARRKPGSPYLEILEDGTLTENEVLEAAEFALDGLPARKGARGHGGYGKDIPDDHEDGDGHAGRSGR